MSNFDANPFADPFNDKAVTQASTVSQKPSLEDFNPFAEDGGSTSQTDNPPAVVVPSNPPPPYKTYGTGNQTGLSAPPVAAPAPAPEIPGHDELLRRQEELEKKAEELQKREQNLSSANYNPRANNWPPLPKWSPVGPCFYQDFSVDIPNEFRYTVKMLYYLWMFYVFALFDNIFACLAIYIVNANSSTAGPQFGLAILWFMLFAPLSLCWYRPVYKAFRSDSSFNFFLFFFMMFFQVCFSVLMAVGIPGSGWAGWIVAVSQGYNKNVGVGIYASVQATLFSIFGVGSLILLKKVHSIYRSTGASFEKAQQEFATGVAKNPGVQSAAATAVQTSMQGTY